MRPWQQQGPLVNLPRLVREVARSDLVFGWFASWHTFLPVLLARLMRKPVGGRDRRLRHGADARDRLRAPAARRHAPRQPPGHAPRDEARDELPLQPHGGGGQRRDRSRAGDRRLPRRAGPVRGAAAGPARPRCPDGRRRRPAQPRAQGPARVRPGRRAPARRRLRARRALVRRSPPTSCATRRPPT